MAEVYKKPGSPYWYADYTVAKKRKRQSTRRTNKKEAKRVADEMEKRALDAAQLGENDVITLEDALSFYERKHLNSPRGCEARARIDKILGKVEGIEGLSDPKMPFHELTYTMMLDYQQRRLAEGAAEQTINHEINLISATYNIVSHDYKVRPNLKFPRFKIESRSRHLEDHEVKALLEELDPDRPFVGRGGAEYVPENSLGQQPVIVEMRQQNYDLVICLLDTGLRMGELTAVTWDMVDTSDWTFRIDRTKNRGKREVSQGGFMIVHPTDRMRAVLQRRYADRGNNPYVFPKWKRLKDGRWLREAAPQRSTKAIRRAMEKVGINEEHKVRRYGRRDVRSLRDTFATRLADRDVGIDVIQDLLGHATPTMTRKYADVKVERLSMRAAAVLNGAV